MEFNKQTVKALLGVVCGGIAFAAALLHLDVVAGAAGWLLGILSPLLLGCAIAFILNVPMRAMERCLFPHAKKANKLRRPLALLLTVAAVSAVLALAGMVIVPGVRDAVTSIAAQVPEAFERLQESAARFQEYLPLLADQIEGLSIDWASLSQKAVGLVQNWGKGLLISGGGLVSGIVSGVTTFFIGLIFSLYILLQKEKLARQGRQLCYAFLPEAAADQLLNILRLSERTFSSFLSGQCLEAVILGTMFFVSMTLLHFPYALLVGVLIALTALIPIVGAFIGCAVGALLMLVNDPWQALWFIVLFLVLQQIEGNLIYPHVVGSSVGLPSIWVLAAVTVGGGVILDEHPYRHKRNDARVIASLAVRESGSDEAKLVQAVGERGADGMTLADLAACFDEPEEKLVEMLAVLCARGKLVEIAPSRYLTSSTLDRLWTDCETMLTKYHREHPLYAGMRLAEARQRLLRGKARENADAILACFAREGKLTLTAVHCALADFSVHLTKRQSAIREELLRTCRAAGILGKKQDALCALFDKKDRMECARVLESLLSTGELVLLAPELCVEKSVLDAVDARVKAWFETHDTLTLGEFRDALGTSRDHALLVLEYYDRRGILRREGDVRRPGAQFGEIEK